MSTNNTVLYPAGYAYTLASTPDTNYGMQSPLKVYQGDDTRPNAKSIVQFDVSNLISKSKINSAIINFSAKMWYPDDIAGGITGDSTYKSYVKYCSAIANGYVYGSITHTNYSTLLSRGVSETVQCSIQTLSYKSNQIDITSNFANNIKDGFFTFVFEDYSPMLIDSSSISLVINYESVDPVTPVVIAPNGTYENKSKDIKFEWIYKSQTEATQASATLEYRQGSSGSYSTVNIYNSNNYYVMPANTLSDGIIEWRVKTTDSDGKVSDYSYGSFTVISSPAVPIITSVDNKCISNIKWSSADQVAYEIEIHKGNEQVLSKKVSSSDNNYTPNMFFANTTYTIKLRVCNMYGLWSEWGSKVVTLSFTNPTAPNITISQDNANVLITTDTENAILYKSDDDINFIPIHKFDSSKSYIDYRVAHNTKYKYFIRKFDTGYTDSVIESAQIKIKGIILQNDTVTLNAKLSKNPFMNYTQELGTEVAVNFYSGREYGVAEFGEHKSKSITLEIAILKKELEKIQTLLFINKTITYRDFRGDNFQCIIENATITQENRNYYYVGIIINKIEESEEISIYD